MVDRLARVLVVSPCLLLVLLHTTQEPPPAALARLATLTLTLAATTALVNWLVRRQLHLHWDQADQLLCLAVLLPAAALLLYFKDDLQQFSSEIGLKLTSVALCSTLFRLLKMTKNTYETEEMIQNGKMDIGAGLALLNFRFLENVIKGKSGQPGHVDMLRRYLRDSGIQESGTCWICPKVLILFPEIGAADWTNSSGSVADIIDKSYKGDRTVGRGGRTALPGMMISNQPISYKYTVGTQERTCKLEVVKNVDASGNFWYGVIAENRPLNTINEEPEDYLHINVG